LDNGNDLENSKKILEIADTAVFPYRFYKREDNLLGPQVIEELMSVAQGEYILMPGDDDTLNRDMIKVLFHIIKDNDYSLISFASKTIDKYGNNLKVVYPPNYKSRFEAIANLLLESSYVFPATVFKKNVIDFTIFPKTLTTTDWLIWMMCWLQGEGYSSRYVALKYRVHDGQDQRNYGSNLFNLEKFLMYSVLLNNKLFINELASWDDRQVEYLLKIFFENNEYSRDKFDFSVIFLILSIKKLSNKIDKKVISEIYCNSLINLGIIPQLIGLKTFIDDPKVVSLPPNIWKQVNLGVLNMSPNCSEINKLMGIYNFPKHESQENCIKLNCKCENSNKHRIKIRYSNHLLNRSDSFSLKQNFFTEFTQILNYIVYDSSGLFLTNFEKKIIIKFKRKYSSRILNTILRNIK